MLRERVAAQSATQTPHQPGTTATAPAAAATPTPTRLERVDVVGSIRRGQLWVEVRNGSARPHGLSLKDGFTSATTHLATPAGAWNSAQHPIDGSYDVRVEGTDGVVRQFTGSGTEGVEVSSRWTVDGRFLLTVVAERDTIVRITDQRSGRERGVLVRYDEPQVMLISAGDGHYDVAVTAKSLPGWSRRLAG